MPCRLPPDPPPPTSAVVYAPHPSYTTLCAGASHSATSTPPACHKEGTMGGVGCLPPVPTQCLGCADVRSAPALPSASPPGHYTLRLGRASVLISRETPSRMSWDHRPRLPWRPPTLTPLLPRRAGFGDAPPVTPLPILFCTPGRAPVPAVSP